MATLITFLIGFGNLIGDNAHFMAGARKHPCRIFAVVVGESGKGRKGASLGNVRLLFRAVDPTWERDHITTGISSGEGLIYAVRDEVIKKIPIFEGEGKEATRTFVWWYHMDSLKERGLTWGPGGHDSPAEKPDVTTSAPPNKAIMPAAPYKAPKPTNPLESAMSRKR